MKLLIFGASGSGTTTLGKALAMRSDFIHLDVDDYYWVPTTPPYQEKVPLAERNTQLSTNFQSNPKVIVSGSMVSWGKEWETAFDLAVFIRMDNALRMQRLAQREEERYGELLRTDPILKESSAAFLAWANQYEDPNFTGRSLAVHQQWMQKLPFPILQLNGADPLEPKVNEVLQELEKMTQATRKD